MKLWAFVKLSRLHFLVGGAVLYGLGAVTVPGAGPGLYLLGQALVSAAQLTAHYVNEYADFEADRGVFNRTIFSGGSGVLASGALHRRVALRAAIVTSASTLVLAALVAPSSRTAAILGLLALASAWGYSMPPLRILNTGWGEVVASLVVAVLVPVTGAAVNGGTVTTPLAWTVVSLFFIHMAMLLAFELPDLDSDAEAAKTVLAVRLGRTRTRQVMVAAICAAGVLSVLAIARGSTSFWPTALSILPAAVTVISAYQDAYRYLTMAAVTTLMTFAVASLITLAP